MSSRERVAKAKAKSTRKREEIQRTEKTKVDSEALKSEMDDILDEIDSVLEENAAEFVAGYVQKGGQ